MRDSGVPLASLPAPARAESRTRLLAGARAASAIACVVAAACAGSEACEPDRLNVIDLAPVALTSDLVAHYTFDEDGGTIVADHSGNARDGTIVGTGATWITDGGAKFGGALHLDGTSYVMVPNFPSASRSFSVSAWVRTSGWAAGGLQTLASTENVFDGGWEVNVINTLDGAVGMQTAFWDRPVDMYAVSSCNCLPPNTWTHLAFVVDGGSVDSGAPYTMTTYVNGQPFQQVLTASLIAPGSPVLSIGTWSGPGRFLVGDVDDLVIYRRALLASEILSLDQSPPPDVL
jgi:hypothetical protein